MISLAAARFPGRRTGHGGAVSLRRRCDGRLVARSRKRTCWRNCDRASAGSGRSATTRRRSSKSRPMLTSRNLPAAPIQIKNLSPPRFLVIADALAKTVALARDEREVNAVFDVIEPFAAKLAATGRPPFRRRAMLRLIGQALLAQHRVSGRVAVEEKPDVLWDHPELERLYARLADEYELHERADVLKRKLDVIGDTAQALTDIIDADRATRLEAAVVILIVLELIAAIVQIALALHGR